MEAKKRRLLILCTLLLSLSAAAALLVTGRAASVPDLSLLSDDYLLNDNRQVFPLGDAGYAVLSSDSRSCSYVALVDRAGVPLDDKAVKFTFPYQNAALCGENIYLAGYSAGSERDLSVGRLHVPDRKKTVNRIPDTVCDFSRGFFAEAGEKLYLATSPYGAEAEPGSPFYRYIFAANVSNASLTGVPVPGYRPDPPDSSEPLPSGASSSMPSSSGPSASSDPSSVPSSSLPSSSVPSAPSSALPPSSVPSSPSGSIPDVSSGGGSGGSSSAPLYRFGGTVTVETLQAQLDAEGRGASVRVTGADGGVITAGKVGTGALVEVLRGGRTDSRVTALIPGDLTGTGTVTQQDSLLLYGYFTGRQTLNGLFLQAADLNADGSVNTSDLLQIKSRILQSSD